MNVLVDSTVWSIGLRRKRPTEGRERSAEDELKGLALQDRVRIIGPIRQELLSGIREHEHFVRLRTELRAYPDEPLRRDDFESAAEIANRCRSRGIAGSPVDFLICAVSLRREWAIFTLDHDFQAYASVLSLVLHTAPHRH